MSTALLRFEMFLTKCRRCSHPVVAHTKVSDGDEFLCSMVFNSVQCLLFSVLLCFATIIGICVRLKINAIAFTIVMLLVCPVPVHPSELSWVRRLKAIYNPQSCHLLLRMGVLTSCILGESERISKHSSCQGVSPEGCKMWLRLKATNDTSVCQHQTSMKDSLPMIWPVSATSYP